MQEFIHHYKIPHEVGTPVTNAATSGCYQSFCTKGILLTSRSYPSSNVERFSIATCLSLRYLCVLFIYLSVDLSLYVYLSVHLPYLSV